MRSHDGSVTARWVRTHVETKHGPPGRAGRRDSSSSVAPIALLLALPASLPRAPPSRPGSAWSFRSEFGHRRALGRGRRRALRARPDRGRPATAGDRDRQRRRRRRGARPACLARPRQPRVHARRPQRRGARLGARRRDLERARDGDGARRRRDLVPARRPRHRPSSGAHEGVARGRAALDRDCTDCRRARRRGSAASRDRRPPADGRRDGRRGPFRCRSGSWSAGTRTPSRVSASTAPSPPVLRRRCSRRSRRRRSSSIAPSNPCISIWPILAIEPIRAAVSALRVPVVGVSPLIGGKAVKGPADAMLDRLAGGTSPAHVAGCYPDLLTRS